MVCCHGRAALLGRLAAFTPQELKELHASTWGRVCVVVLALEHLHVHGLTHGDVKPESELPCLPGCLAAWLSGCLAAWLPGCRLCMHGAMPGRTMARQRLAAPHQANTHLCCLPGACRLCLVRGRPAGPRRHRLRVPAEHEVSRQHARTMLAALAPWRMRCFAPVSISSPGWQCLQRCTRCAGCSGSANQG